MYGGMSNTSVKSRNRVRSIRTLLKTPGFRAFRISWGFSFVPPVLSRSKMKRRMSVSVRRPEADSAASGLIRPTNSWHVRCTSDSSRISALQRFDEKCQVRTSCTAAKSLFDHLVVARLSPDEPSDIVFSGNLRAALPRRVNTELGVGESKARAGAGFKHSHDILFQQVDRHRQEYDILHQERNVASHRRKSSNRIPAIRHERDDRDGHDERASRPDGSQDSQSLVPKSQEQ